MRNLIFLLFLGAVVFLVTGWFLDWYDITGVKNANGKTSIQFDINRDKIKGDIGKGTDKFKDTWNNISEDKEKNSTPASSSKVPSGW
jgi:hypothetical protein